MRLFSQRRSLFIAALSLVGLSGLAWAASVGTTFVASGTTSALRLERKESLGYYISGTFTGTVYLERSFDAVNYAPVPAVTVTNNTGGRNTGVVRTDDSAAYFRFRASTITAGSMVVRLDDRPDFVSEVTNLKREPVVKYYDNNVQFASILTFEPSNNEQPVILSTGTEITKDTFNRTFNVVTATGAISVNSTPTISTDTANVGDIYIIQSARDTITFTDNGTLSGSALELGDTTRAMGVGDILMLIFRGGKWWELGYCNN